MDSELSVYARSSLAPALADISPTAVLLEGAWQESASGAERHSLDAELGPEFAWLDKCAAVLVDDLAPRFAATSTTRPTGDDLLETASPAYLNALALRYHLLKLLRVATYFTEVRPLATGECVRLAAVRQVDDDYAELLAQVCGARGARLEIDWHEGMIAARPPVPPNGLSRRLLGVVDGWLARMRQGSRGPRVVLCGNPRLLDPIRASFAAEGARVWWLNDRFALRSFGRGWADGAPQLCCDGSIGCENLLAMRVPARLDFHGVDLSGSVGLWLARRMATDGARQSRWLKQIEKHFARVRPDALLLDEDATPFKRAAVAVARRYGVSSAVVQHGAPCARFGFAPLAADRIFVWGESSRAQLLRWNVASERIVVTGAPLHDRLRQTLAARPSVSVPGESRPPRILLLGTMPPRDQRPDLVSMQFTTAAYAEMLRVALAGVSKLAGARLSIKLHPRLTSDPILDATLADFLSLDVRILRAGHAEQYLAEADCVLSLISSAGVDATLSGVPVIQILPRGAVDLLPASDWGALGNARTEPELDALLNRALSSSRGAPAKVSPHIFGDFREPAASRIAHAALACPAPLNHPELQAQFH